MVDRNLYDQLEALGDDPDAEYDALMRRQRTPATEREEPEVGTSETARQLDRDGYFDDLARQFGHERQQRERRAVEESQGFSETGITGAVRDFFGRSRDAFQQGIAAPLSVDRRESYLRDGGVLGDAGRLTPEEAQRVVGERTGSSLPWNQSEIERAESTAPFWRGVEQAIPEPPRVPGIVSGVTGIARGLVGAVATRQEERLAKAQGMLRGEVELPQYAEWRSLVDNGSRTVADMFTSLPIQYAGIIGGYAVGTYNTGNVEFQDNKLYKFGQSIERAVHQAFPGDKARQFEFSHSLVQGLASTLAFGGQGVIAHLLGAGPRGQLALIGLSGMASQTPQEFARVTQALERGDATERDRIIAVLANSALGATEALPFANTIAGNARGLAGRAARGGEQALEEMAQEAIQQSGQNVTRMLSYDPMQAPYEGVLESMVVAAISGFGYGTAFSGGGRQQATPAPVREARARTGGARPDAAPERPAAIRVPQSEPEPPARQYDPVRDPFDLERFAPPPPAARQPADEVRSAIDAIDDDHAWAVACREPDGDRR